MREYVVKLESVVGGGQTIASVKLADGQIKKAFIWGGLPGETVKFVVTKKRAGILEGIVTEVIEAVAERIKPRDELSFLSTSPWQIYNYQYELEQKIRLTKEAFAGQKIPLTFSPRILTDGIKYHYRNKMEFTWWWDKTAEQLELATYRRGSKGKIVIKGSSLAREEINVAASNIRNVLNKNKFEARDLKTLLLRSNQQGKVVAQLYVTTEKIKLTEADFKQLNISGLEIILSDPRSPASVINRRLQTFGEVRLSDELLGRSFSYPAESFFQINLPVYELALKEITQFLLPNKPVVDLYSGVGTIGLTVAGDLPVTLVEINQAAVTEMQQNIEKLGINKATAVLAASEDATSYITSDCQLIIDPPRAGLHSKVVASILEKQPRRIIYLSCNVATQARDVALLTEKYQIMHGIGFNFFPRTPHIENLIVLDLKN